MIAERALQQKVRVAIFLMRRASPLPLDLETYLIANGIDVAALDAIHRH